MKAVEASTHVLLVEDNHAVAQMTSRLLRRCPVNVTVAHVESGEAGLAYMRKDHPYADRPRPGLIVLDLGLPGMSGHEVLRHLKRSPVWRGIPVVIFSGSDRESDRRAAEENGASGYLRKPSSYEEWVQVVKNLWERCSGPRCMEGSSGMDGG